MRWLLAALSFGAGAVHLVMVPQHAQESLRMGLAFAAAGWFQIAFGAAMLAAPRRIWLWLAIVANIVFIATWVISRTAGLPDWTGDGGIEKRASGRHPQRCARGHDRGRGSCAVGRAARARALDQAGLRRRGRSSPCWYSSGRPRCSRRRAPPITSTNRPTATAPRHAAHDHDSTRDMTASTRRRRPTATRTARARSPTRSSRRRPKPRSTR